MKYYFNKCEYLSLYLYIVPRSHYAKHLNKTKMITRLLFCLIFLTGFAALQARVEYAAELAAAELPVGTILKWTTQVEDDHEIFMVERSTDGISYENIGMVEAAGNVRNGKDYRFLDNNFSGETSYYRLRHIDFDGTASFSQTVSVRRTLRNDFAVARIRQAEISGLFECSIDCRAEGNLIVSVHNYNGQLVASHQHTFGTGLNDLTTDLAEQPEGIYFLTLEMNGETERLAFVKVAATDGENPTQVRKN